MKIFRLLEKTPIRNKVLTFGIIMSVVPVILISLYYLSFIQVELKDKISQNQLLVVQNLAYEMDQQFKEIDKKEILLYELMENNNEEAIYQFLKEEPSIEEVVVLTNEGTIQKSYHRFLLNDQNKGMHWKPWDTLLPIEGGKNSKVHFNEFEQPIIYSISTIQLNGEPCTIALTIQVQKLLGRIQSLHIENNELVYLIDEEQKIIAHQNVSQLSNHFSPTTNEKVVQFTAPIKENNWTLVLEQEKLFTYEPISQLINHSILVILILLLIVSIISIRAGMYFTEPIVVLKKAMGELKSNPSTRISHSVINRQDELGDLTNSFNEMSQAIQQKTLLLKKETEKLTTIIQGIQADFIFIEKQSIFHWLKCTTDNMEVKHLLEEELKKLLIDVEEINPLKNLVKKLLLDTTNQVYQFKLFPMFLEEDKDNYLVMIEDITESNNLEEKLIQADKLSALGMMASGFAHEVNNPLTIISVYTEDMLDQLQEEEGVEKVDLLAYLEKVEVNVKRCKKITTNLLNFSRPTNWVNEQIDLKTELENTLFLVEHELKRKKLTYSLELSEDRLFIQGDKWKFMQVIVNLLQNAIDASYIGSKISIKAFEQKEQIVIQIMDKGMGIPKEHQKKILDPFYTTKPQGKGTGLGLFITYHIIERFGGNMEFIPNKEKGTKVVLTFSKIKNELV